MRKWGNCIMSRLAKLILPAAILIAGLAINSRTSWAVPNFARKTGKECSFCHPPGSWNLTEAGKYYRDHKYSLNGYKPKSPEKSTQNGGK
jgi:hypothetical protein